MSAALLSPVVPKTTMEGCDGGRDGAFDEGPADWNGRRDTRSFCSNIGCFFWLSEVVAAAVGFISACEVKSHSHAMTPK